MSDTIIKPLSIEEFDQLELPEDRDFELHAGELVEMTFPNVQHRLIQQQLVQLFNASLSGALAIEELPFQSTAGGEKRSADVGILSLERLRIAFRNGILLGTPDLVVEVLSPSNSYQKLKKYRKLCLENDTAVFLTVDPQDKTIESHARDAKTGSIWTLEEDVLLGSIGEAPVVLPVRAVFSGIVSL